MKKLWPCLLFGSAAAFACVPGDGHNHGNNFTPAAANAPTARSVVALNLFSGAWCVEGDDMRIEFIGKDSVTFSSENDPSVNGTGKFSHTDTHLSAQLSNSGMNISIVYRYTRTPRGLSVLTERLEINSSPVNANPEPISLVRCGN